MTIPLTSMTTKASAGASSTSTGVTEDGAGYAETLLMPGPGTMRPPGARPVRVPRVVRTGTGSQESHVSISRQHDTSIGKQINIILR